MRATLHALALIVLPAFAGGSALAADGAADEIVGGAADGTTDGATDADGALVEFGGYLATAGDCAGCHGTSFEGGNPIASPMGDIYSSNITPDVDTGIGGWTLEQFTDALRKGEGSEGHIFPAMPYTSYTGLADEEIRALYAWFMLGVEPVAYEPPETDLPFPFVRPAMIVWNALFLDEGRAVGAVDVTGEREERGRLLVESLGHCTACHTPRGQMMQPLSDRHLAGAMIGGWWAPNITPDPSGIGEWSDERLARFLATGHVAGAVAAGEMSKVVERSLSLLRPDDIEAIVAYLRAVPPIASDETGGSAAAAAADTNVTSDAASVVSSRATGGPRALPVESSAESDWQALLGHDTEDGGTLYQSACATCHGLDGRGSPDTAHPSLHRVDGVVAPQGATLVQVIAHGVDRRVGNAHAFMPGFRDDLDDGQIASLANHVRTAFGGVAGDITTDRVDAVLAGTIDTPWLISNAHRLAIAAIVLVCLIVVAGGAWVGLRKARG